MEGSCWSWTDLGNGPLSPPSAALPPHRPGSLSHLPPDRALPPPLEHTNPRKPRIDQPKPSPRPTNLIRRRQVQTNLPQRLPRLVYSRRLQGGANGMELDLAEEGGEGMGEEGGEGEDPEVGAAGADGGSRGEGGAGLGEGGAS